MKKMYIVSEMEAMVNEKVDFLSVLSACLCDKLINCSKLWKLQAVVQLIVLRFQIQQGFPL